MWDFRHRNGYRLSAFYECLMRIRRICGHRARYREGRQRCQWCRLRCGWNLGRRVLRSHEGIVSGCEVNWLIDGLCCERLPAIDFAHIDLA